MMRKLLSIAVVVWLPGVCQAGWLGDTILDTGKRLGERAIHETGSGAYEGAKDSVKGSGKKPEKSSEDRSTTDRDGDASDDSGPKRSPGKRPASDADDRGSRATGGTSADASIDQAESIQSRYDFVPGDKTIFFDDFGDTDVGEFPRKWTLDGPKEYSNNSVEVAEFQGRRYLRSTPSQKGKAQADSTQYIRLSQKGDLPEKFTVEFDAVFANSGDSHYENFYYLYLLGDVKHHPGGVKGTGILRFSGERCESANTQNELSLVDGKPHRVQVMVNGTFVKAYVDQQRVINDPDGIKRPIRHIGILMGSPNRMTNEKVMFTNFRLAQGGKDIRSALSTDGKIVTHGILFDSGKDVLKAESLPTLKTILGLMNDDPGLRFSIEGHTDNQGSRDVNKPLSERRAAAVKDWLAAKGIDGSRMKTAGFGDSRPIDPNNTPEGRANNRRVEFVKF